MAALLVVITVLLLVAVDALRLWLRRRSGAAAAEPVRAFTEVRVPRGLFLDGAHGWARLAASGELRVGVDELLAQAVGGVDRIDLPQPGEAVEKGQRLATLWRLGRRLDLAAPVSGTVVTANKTVKENLNALTADPYGAGWLAVLWPVEHTEALRGLHVGERAVRWLEREIQRFADFLAARTSPELLGAALPDGAHPVIGAALALDDEAWEAFAREFAGGDAKEMKRPRHAQAGSPRAPRVS